MPAAPATKHMFPTRLNGSGANKMPEAQNKRRNKIIQSLRSKAGYRNLAYELGKLMLMNCIAWIAGFFIFSLGIKWLFSDFAGPFCFFSMIGSLMHLALIWTVTCVRRKCCLVALSGFVVVPILGIMLANIYFYLHAIMGILNYNPY
jgi:hypothetical protein